MRYPIALPIALAALCGCTSASTPSDSAQQQLAKDWSPDKVADAYEKAGKHAEAEEVRRSANQGQQ